MKLNKRSTASKIRIIAPPNQAPQSKLPPKGQDDASPTTFPEHNQTLVMNERSNSFQPNQDSLFQNQHHLDPKASAFSIPQTKPNSV